VITFRPAACTSSSNRCCKECRCCCTACAEPANARSLAIAGCFQAESEPGHKFCFSQTHVAQL
jgi:hypothetical protein